MFIKAIILPCFSRPTVARSRESVPFMRQLRTSRLEGKLRVDADDRVFAGVTRTSTSTICLGVFAHRPLQPGLFAEYFGKERVVRASEFIPSSEYLVQVSLGDGRVKLVDGDYRRYDCSFVSLINHSRDYNCRIVQQHGGQRRVFVQLLRYLEIGDQL